MEYVFQIMQTAIQIAVNDLYIKEKQYDRKHILYTLGCMVLIPVLYYSIDLLCSPLILIILYMRNTTFIKDKNDAMIHTAINSIFGIVSDHIVSFLLYSKTIMNLPYTLGSSIGFTSLHLAVWTFIFIAISYIAYKIYAAARINLTKKNKNLISVSLLLVYLFQFIIIYNTRIHGGNIADILRDGLILVILVSLALLSAYFFFKQHTHNRVQREREIEVKNLRNYTEQLETNYNDMRKFRHDYINILSSMSELIQENDQEALQSYFNSTIIGTKDLLIKNSFKLEMLSNIKIQSVKGLIATKLFKAQELGFDVHFEALNEITWIEMDELDFCRCIGILIDNAIESKPKGQVSVAFIKHSDAISFIVENTIVDSNISLNQCFTEGYSTKGQDRGLGLVNLKSIIDTYPTIHLDTSISSKHFTQEIIMKGHNPNEHLNL